MAIAKRPKNTPDLQAVPSLTDEERERREQEFLAGAPDVSGKQTKSEEKPKRQKMQTVHLRFEPDLLPRMDAAARESGLDDRSAWIRYVVKQALKQLDTSNQ
ncbi:MAG: hypothetical protein QOJ59_599 [Thermomicrobiales bacterium]|jgi:hypothetical protein|nr:hypothetical protein [Thermomicrobiales bacterium]